MQNGLVLFYIKDDLVYPVALTKEQYINLQLFGKTLEPIKLINKPIGEAVNMINSK